jgi:predicted nucleotidyltransferase
MNERREKLAEICRRYKVAILYSFGSRGKEALSWLNGETNMLAPGVSDLDIGAKAEPGNEFPLFEQIRMTVELEDLFEIHRVDFVLLDRTDPFLAANIIRGERLYAENSYAADEYELYVLRRAGDLAPFERQRIAQILGERS